MRTAVTPATGHASVRTRQQDLTERILMFCSFSVYQMTVEQAQELVRGEPGSGNLAWSLIMFTEPRTVGESSATFACMPDSSCNIAFHKQAIGRPIL